MSSATSTTTTTTTRADHAELFAAVPQQADDDEARADLRLLDDDYVDPLACAVAGHRWSALELAAYGSYRYCCVRARVEQDYAQLQGQRFLCLRSGEELGLRELRARLSGVYAA